MTTSIEDALKWQPPSKEQVGRELVLRRRYFDPESIGIENISTDRPTLFVGNHTRYGLIDLPILTQEIYLKTGLYPRGLADRVHYKVPFWNQLVTKAGGVIGSREMCQAMMDGGESVLVFPGGTREVFKGRGLDYQLMWENRYGFVKMAIEAGYSITPFCSVGADEVFDVALDGNDVSKSFIGRYVEAAGRKLFKGRKDIDLVIPRGMGLSFMPRPEKFYFAFGEAIDTSEYNGLYDDVVLREVQERTQKAVEELIDSTIAYRDEQADRLPRWRKLLKKF